jgi:hypothetical protein
MGASGPRFPRMPQRPGAPALDMTSGPTVPTPARAPRSRTRRVAGWALLVFIGLLLVAGGLYLFRGKLLVPLALRWIETRSDGRLSIEAVEGDLVHSIALLGLRFEAGEPHEELRLVTARRIDAGFSLWRLIRGEADWLESVAAQDVVLHADLTVGRRDQPRRPPSWAMPVRLPRGSLEAFSLELELEGGRHVSIAGGRAELERAGEASPLTASAERLTWTGPEGGERSGSMRGSGVWRGGVIEIERLALDSSEVLSDSQVDLRELPRGAFAWALHVAAFSGRARIDGSFRERRLELDYRLDGVDLGEGWRFLWAAHERKPEGILDVTGRYSHAFAPPRELSGAVEGTASAARWAGYDLGELDAKVAFTREELAIERLRAVRGENRLAASEARVPFGREGPLETLRASRGSFALELVNLPGLIASFTGEPSEPARVPPHRLRVEGRLEEAGAGIEAGHLQTDGGELRLSRGRIEWGERAEDLLAGAELDLDLEADFSDLSPLGPILATEPWSGSLRGTLHVSGPVRRLQGEAEFTGREVVAAGLPLGDLKLRAVATREGVQVRALEAQGELAQLSLSGRYTLAERRFDSVVLSADVPALERVLPRFFLSGAAHVEAQLEGTLAGPEGSFEVQSSGVRLAALETRVLDSLYVRGSQHGEALRIDELRAGLERGAIQLQGTLHHRGWSGPMRVELEQLHAEREGLELALASPVEIALDTEARSLDFEGAELEGTAGRLTATFHGTAQDFLARVEALELDPMPLLAAVPGLPEGFLLEGAHGQLALARERGRLAIASHFELDRVRLASGEPDLGLTARGRLEGGFLTIEQLSLVGEEGLLIWIEGAMPFDPFGPELLGAGDVDLLAEVSVPRLEDLPWQLLDFEPEMLGDLRAFLQIQGTWSALRGDLSFDASSLAFGAGPAAGHLGPAALTGRLSLGQALEIEWLRLDSPDQATLEMTGHWGIAGDLRALAGGDLSDARAAPLELDARLTAQDLSFLAGWYPLFRRVGGALSAEMGIAGSLEHLELSGGVRLEDGELRLATELPALEKVEAVLELEGDRLVIERLSGEIAGGPFACTGAVRLEGLEPILDIDLLGYEVLLVQTETLRLRADAELSFEGPLAELEIGGSATVSDGRWSRNFDYFGIRPGGAPTVAEGRIDLFSFREPPLSQVAFDVRIASREPFRIENNLMRAKVRPDLHLGGSGAAPELTGTVYADSGLVKLPASTLRLTTGTVQFVEENPLIPYLDLTLQTRMRGYDITVHVGGTSADPEVELSSVPPLTSEGILTLVLTGQPPEQGLTAEGGGEAAQSVALFVGQDLISRWFDEGGVSDEGESIFERIEYTTGTDVTKAGEETAQMSVRLTGDPTGKAGQAVFMRAEKDVYDRINFGLRWTFRFD